MAKKDTFKQTWNAITGTATVFAKEFKGDKGKYFSYSLSIGTKLGNDKEYTNYYFTVRFSKELQLDLIEGANQIDIKDAWLKVESYTTGKGRNAELVIKPVIFINDAEVI